MKVKSAEKPNKIHGGQLPGYVSEAVEKEGLSTKDLIYSCPGDMDRGSAYCDCWLFFDSKGLYIITGFQTNERARLRGQTVHEPVYNIKEINSIPAEDIDKLEIERYSSTGRLIMSKNGEQMPLIYFSLGRIGGFDNLVRAYNSYRETGTPELPSEDEHSGGTCKKCGAPCPPDKEFCREHEKNKGTAVRLIKFFGGYLPQVSAIILMMVIQSAATIFVPQVSTRALYDNILANPSGAPAAEMLKALTTLVLSVFGLRLLSTLLNVAQDYLTASITPRVTYDIKLRIFEAMQRLSVGFYSSRQTGSLMDRVSRDAENVYWFFLEGVPRLIISSVTLIGVVAIMFSMSVRLSLSILLALPLLFVTLVVGDRIFRRMHHRVWVSRAKTNSLVSDNINGQRIIKAFSKEDDEYDHFSELSGKFRDAGIKLGVSAATLFPVLEILVLLLSALVLGMGGVMVVKGTDGMTAGKLLSFVVYLEMLRAPFGNLAMMSNGWARCSDAAQRIFEISDAIPEITEKENAVGFENIRGEIDINELEFEYEPARPIIQKLSLHVSAGDMLGIVGRTGAGKTTIANLIARLYDAKEGSVKIDGIDVKDLKIRELRRNIGLVSQDIYLFYGSITENIRYARPDASMDEVIAAAKAACAHDFIMKLPDAYETRVGAGGQSLSGGERQRISIARTIIQNPKILILDEATAAMDTETERNIQNSLGLLSKGRTTIAIAHRLSTLRDSDYLAVIDGGKIAEYGTFKELLDLKGEFYRQYTIQAEALKTIGIAEFAEDHPHDGDEEENDGNQG